ncbi:hypothetical protein ACIQ9Q_41455 [Streptomyces sp. NPDC094438]|uniref:hypothetical protein n=1 Tax=Streptomyces sp. NPDC094438 TaxID=3366061 RepID=UPI0037F158B5
MATSPLIVPVVVKALAVTPPVTHWSTFARWHLDFRKVRDHYQEPEPSSTFNFDTFGQETDLGVYVHWQLPDALESTRPRKQETSSNAPVSSFPLVPNRWLVVRYSRPEDKPDVPPKSTGWVVHSDYVSTDPDTSEPVTGGSASFVHPWERGEDGSLKRAWIGRLHDLKGGDKPWKEPDPAGDMFLTANGPGMIEFSRYQPYNKNVFSLHDRLEDLDLETPQRLSYLVIGWYSDEKKDLLAEDLKDSYTQNLQTLIDRLRWQCSESNIHRRSLYAGTVLGLSWRFGKTVEDPQPESDRPSAPDAITVSVGNTAVEAQTALLTAAAPQFLSNHEATLFEVFQNKWADRLDSEPFLDIVLRHARQEKWFSSADGGFHWEAADNRTEPTKPRNLSAEEIDRERAILAELNDHQNTYDLTVFTLRDTYQRLLGLWQWTVQENDENTKKKAAEAWKIQSDPRQENSLAHQIASQLTTLIGSDGTSGLRAQLPQGDTTEHLEASIRTYAADKQLPLGRQLQRLPLPPFHHSHDAALLLQGVKGDGLLAAPGPLPCRTTDQTITRVRVGSKDITNNDVTPPLKLLSGLPEQETLTRILTEFTLLDRVVVQPGKALEDLAEPSKDLVIGTLPWHTRRWQQPWSPTFLLWKIKCFRIPFAEKWDFTETGYSWNGQGAETGHDITGRTYLIPLLEFITKNQAKQYGSSGLSHLYSSLSEQATQWDQLSVTLTGINAWLARRAPANNFFSEDALGLGLGSGAHKRVPDPTAPGPYCPMRAAQFYFTRLTVVDTFGRSFDLIIGDRAKQATVHVSPDLTPQPDKLAPAGNDSVSPGLITELPPRLHQRARLRFDFIDARSNTPLIDLSTKDPHHTTPVCAWLLPLHIRSALAVYSPEGLGLGEIRPHPSGTATSWIPYPGSPYPSLGGDSAASLKRDHPHLHRFLTGLNQKGDTLRGFLPWIGNALQSIAPPLDDTEDARHLALLLSRPLALLRTRIGLELEGPLLTDSTLDRLISPAPTSPDVEAKARIGDPNLLADGLLGYYTDTDTNLHAIALSTTTPDATGYRITGTELSLPAYPLSTTSTAKDTSLTLLADPTATLHAVTHILPPTTLRLPPSFLREALSRINPVIPTGPLLATTDTTHISMPTPTAWRGHWIWTGPTTPETTLTPNPPDPALPQTPSQALTGYLTIKPDNPA